MTEHPTIEPRIKRKIWESQGKRCAYCGEPRNLKHMTVDHVIPLSKGGTNDEENLRCACKMCNRIKNDMLPTEFSVFIHRMFMNNLAFCEMELQNIN